ncbi:MAG: hypothetical protein KDE58_26870, partial [Caldilineaceae bacterium]|nr:hypothetical protein [Caldilineaceae bacterium]
MVELLSIILMMTVSLLGGISQSTQTPSATDAGQASQPTPTAQAATAATPTPEPTPFSWLKDGQQIRFENVSLTVDPAIDLSNVALAIVPAPEEQDDLPYFALVPEHLHFELVGFMGVAEPRFPAQIDLYPVSAYELMGGHPVTTTTTLLHSLLQERPALETEEALPYLPLVNAAQIMHAQAQYIDFDGGAGIRYLTAFHQDAFPISNGDLLYTFQGLTDDGRYVVAASFPVATSALPDEIAPGAVDSDFDAEANAADVTETLNGLGSAEFTPDLTLLDELFHSLAVTPPNDSAVTTTQLITATQIITFTPPLPETAAQEGSCWTNSLSTLRADAWRCTVGNRIYDPCFALPDETDILVCGADPSSDEPGFPLHLTEPLPIPDLPAQAQAMAATNGWLVLLGDGTLCNFATGATTGVNGERLNYLCAGGGGLLGDLHPD